MKNRGKWIARAGILGFVAVVIWRIEAYRSRFSVGQALPAGSVSPLLAIGMGGAVLIAPDGTLWAWGNLVTASGKRTNTESPVQISSDNDWRKLAVGGWNNTFAIKSNGTLWGWGGYPFESHGTPNPSIRYTRSSRPERIGIDENWREICAGHDHFLALKTDGSLWAWGNNYFGQVGNGTTNETIKEIVRITTNTDWAAIVLGDLNSFALKTNGSIWAWGKNFFDEGWSPPDQTRRDLSPRQIDPGTNWTGIALDYGSLLALRSDGTLWICGRDWSKGRQDYWNPNSKDDQSSIFVPFGQGTDWQSIGGFGSGLLAVKRDGSCWFFGEYDAAAFGNGKPLADTKTLQRLDTKPWALWVEGLTTLLLTKDGKLWSLGERLGYDPTTPMKLDNAADHLLGRYYSGGLGGFAFQHLSIDRSPRKIWELPPAMVSALSDQVKVDSDKRR